MSQTHDTFTVRSVAKSGIQSTWSSSAQDLSSLTMAIPAQFQGPGGGASPEDLYALSLLNCFMAMFKIIAEKSQFPFDMLSGEAILTPGKNADGKLMMKHVLMKIKLTGVSDKEKAGRLLEKASSSCLIINSVLTEKTMEYEIEAL